MDHSAGAGCRCSGPGHCDGAGAAQRGGARSDARRQSLHQAEVTRAPIGDRDGLAEFAVPIVTSARTDTGTGRIGSACVGHEALRVSLRSLDALAAERFDQDRRY